MSKNKVNKGKVSRPTNLVVIGSGLSIWKSSSESKTILATPKTPAITSKPLEHHIKPLTAADIAPSNKDMPQAFKPYTTYSKHRD